ncbi:MAG: CBS domain-containing protein [Deltaproteobacteria bacterium]|nr:CBS domain-containing protein [Deltaproteobacteria bacterium]
MNVASIMTRSVLTVEMDYFVQIIRDIFNNFEFHHIPVLENQKLVGVISDRDLIDREERNTITLDSKAHEIMSRTPITVDVETRTEKAGDLLLENNISCLPVISPQGSVKGIVTWKDILKFYLKNKKVGMKNE